jgi:hypothetical protein
MTNWTRFKAAIARFDQENARDPNLESIGGGREPRELVYARWLTDWVLRLCPDASEELRLAARAQHLCRWLVPRDSYSATRAGYLQWREALKQFHAHKAAGILQEVGYADETIGRVEALIRKQLFPNDPESRVLEDALCLVFLEHQFAELAGKTPDDKMIGVLQKTWKKMTPAARSLALAMEYRAPQKALLERALKPKGV